MSTKVTIGADGVVGDVQQAAATERPAGGEQSHNITIAKPLDTTQHDNTVAGYVLANGAEPSTYQRLDGQVMIHIGKMEFTVQEAKAHGYLQTAVAQQAVLATAETPENLTPEQRAAILETEELDRSMSKETERMKLEEQAAGLNVLTDEQKGLLIEAGTDVSTVDGARTHELMLEDLSEQLAQQGYAPDGLIAGLTGVTDDAGYEAFAADLVNRVGEEVASETINYAEASVAKSVTSIMKEAGVPQDETWDAFIETNHNAFRVAGIELFQGSTGGFRRLLDGYARR